MTPMGDLVFDREGAPHVRIETEAGFHLTETPLSRDQDVLPLEDDWMQITATVGQRHAAMVAQRVW